MATNGFLTERGDGMSPQKKIGFEYTSSSCIIAYPKVTLSYRMAFKVVIFVYKIVIDKV